MTVSPPNNLRPDGPRELASGIDTLIISLRGVLSESLANSLAEAKATAGDLQISVEVNLGGVAWQLQPGRFGMYPYRLQHEYGLLGITDSLALPTFRWQPLAEALHAFGPATIGYWLIDIAEAEVGPVTTTVSRLDLHADFQGLFFRPENKESFICRARSCVANWDEGIFSGFSFGKRSSKSAYSRLYDKTLEITKKGGSYWFDLWGDAYEPEETVWRIEGEFHRGLLRQCGITTLEDAFAKMGGLWKYFTEEWLSLRIPSSDATHSRWRVDPLWIAVQGASLASDAVSIERVRETRRDDSLRRTVPQVVGWLARYAAISGHETIEDVIQALPVTVELHERSSKVDFPDRVGGKRKDMGLP